MIEPSYGGGEWEVSLPEMGESLSQLVAGAVYVGLHRTERKVEDFGDLLVRSSLDVTEQNAGAILGAEQCYGALDGAAKLAGFDGVERGLAAIPDLERGRLDGLGRLGVRSEEHTSELQSRLHLVCRLL